MDSCPCSCLHVSKISKFVLIDHGSLLFGNGRHICYIVISSSCTLAVIRLHASLCQLSFTHFFSEAMFQGALLLICRGIQEEEVAAWHNLATYSTIGLGIIDHCDHIVGFILNSANSHQQLFGYENAS